MLVRLVFALNGLICAYIYYRFGEIAYSDIVTFGNTIIRGGLSACHYANLAIDASQVGTGTSHCVSISDSIYLSVIVYCTQTAIYLGLRSSLSGFWRVLGILVVLYNPVSLNLAILKANSIYIYYLFLPIVLSLVYRVTGGWERALLIGAMSSIILVHYHIAYLFLPYVVLCIDAIVRYSMGGRGAVLRGINGLDIWGILVYSVATALLSTLYIYESFGEISKIQNHNDVGKAVLKPSHPVENNGFSIFEPDSIGFGAPGSLFYIGVVVSLILYVSWFFRQKPKFNDTGVQESGANPYASPRAFAILAMVLLISNKWYLLNPLKIQLFEFLTPLLLFRTADKTGIFLVPTLLYCLFISFKGRRLVEFQLLVASLLILSLLHLPDSLSGSERRRLLIESENFREKFRELEFISRDRKSPLITINSKFGIGSEYGGWIWEGSYIGVTYINGLRDISHDGPGRILPYRLTDCDSLKRDISIHGGSLALAISYGLPAMDFYKSLRFIRSCTSVLREERGTYFLSATLVRR